MVRIACEILLKKSLAWYPIEYQASSRIQNCYHPFQTLFYTLFMIIASSFIYANLRIIYLFRGAMYEDSNKAF